MFWQGALRLLLNGSTKSGDATVVGFANFVKVGGIDIPDFGCCRTSKRGIESLANEMDAEAARLYIGEVENLVAKVLFLIDLSNM